MQSRNQTELNVYLLPGMGADERLYAPMDIKHGNLHYIRWSYQEHCKSLTDYAEYLVSTIKTDNNVLIGSSMGGMVAVEMYKIGTFNGLILISAPASSVEFPPSLKALGAIRFGKLFNRKLMFRMSRLANTFMGFKEKEHERVFYEMLEGYGPEFLHFAVNAILNWKTKDKPDQYLQIIGSNDRLFKEKRMNCPIVLPGSGHFLTFEQPEPLSDLINQFLSEKLDILNY